MAGKRRISKLAFALVLAGISVRAGEGFDPKLLRVVDQCSGARAGTREVYLIKQWHWSPGLNSKLPHAVTPQATNQSQIYAQLDKWVKGHLANTFIAEGCEGEINSKFKESYQGWSYEDLKRKAGDPAFDAIETHAILKLKAAHDEIQALCGDDPREIKRSELALSDARGDLGFLSRILESAAHPERARTFIEGAIESLNLKPDAGLEQVKRALMDDLKKSIEQFEKSTHERNLAFYKVILNSTAEKPIVLVIGGLHAADLKKIFEEHKIACRIYEPLAYQADEEALSSKLKAALAHF